MEKMVEFEDSLKKGIRKVPMLVFDRLLSCIGVCKLFFLFVIVILFGANGGNEEEEEMCGEREECNFLRRRFQVCLYLKDWVRAKVHFEWE